VLCEGLKPERFEIMDVNRGEVERAQSLQIRDHFVDAGVGTFGTKLAAGGQR
jgi:hypothetical protein